MMIPKKPILGLDPRMGTAFRKSSCSIKMPAAAKRRLWPRRRNLDRVPPATYEAMCHGERSRPPGTASGRARDYPAGPPRARTRKRTRLAARGLAPLWAERDGRHASRLCRAHRAVRLRHVDLGVRHPRRGILVDLRRRYTALASGGRLADRSRRHFPFFALTLRRRPDGKPVILTAGHAEYTRR